MRWKGGVGSWEREMDKEGVGEGKGRWGGERESLGRDCKVSGVWVVLI